MELTSKKSEDSSWYNRLPQSDGHVLLLDVVLEGQVLFAHTKLGRTAVLVKAVDGWHPLGVGQRRLAAPGVQPVEALHAVQGALQ